MPERCEPVRDPVPLPAHVRHRHVVIEQRELAGRGDLLAEPLVLPRPPSRPPPTWRRPRPRRCDNRWPATASSRPRRSSSPCRCAPRIVLQHEPGRPRGRSTRCRCSCAGRDACFDDPAVEVELQTAHLRSCFRHVLADDGSGISFPPCIRCTPAPLAPPTRQADKGLHRIKHACSPEDGAPACRMQHC
jgi:hypothetical protein